MAELTLDTARKMYERNVGADVERVGMKLRIV